MKSLTPFDVTTPRALRRLNAITKPAERKKDPEIIFMRLWEEANIPISEEKVPIEIILNKNRKEEISQREIAIASSVVQWLATNIGRCFYEQFLEKITHRTCRSNTNQIMWNQWHRMQRETSGTKSITQHLLHVCTSECTEDNGLVTAGIVDTRHHYLEPSKAEEKVIMDTLFWTASEPGQMLHASMLTEWKEMSREPVLL